MIIMIIIYFDLDGQFPLITPQVKVEIESAPADSDIFKYLFLFRKVL